MVWSKKMLVLDLYCGCGGAAMGIKRACEKKHIDVKIFGVDIVEQPDYPFFFYKQDISKTKRMSLQYDFVWASPPCQAYSQAAAYNRSHGKIYPELIDFTRELIQGIPYCIENVPQAPIRHDVILTGTHFGLPTVRKRAFELNGFFALSTPRYPVKGTVKYGENITCAGYGTTGKGKISDFQKALGIDWTKDRKALVNAVPPVYSEYIFTAFLENYLKEKINV